MFKKASRKKSKARLCLMGPTGCGKTYSALLMARGIVGAEGRIAMIDTEHGSGELYSDLTDYDVARLKPPYSPDRFIERIVGAEKAGYDALIIDSFSHAWIGAGGILEITNTIAATSRSKNTHIAWGKTTPMHENLINTMLEAEMHLIVTMRMKMGHEQTTDEQGRKSIIKTGLQPRQREDTEYEFTTVITMLSDHLATSTKDRTGLFDGRAFTPTEADGTLYRNWLDTGDERPETVWGTPEHFAKAAGSNKAAKAVLDKLGLKGWGTLMDDEKKAAYGEIENDQ